MDEEHPEGWTKPKQSFRLKKSIPRKRPVLGASNTTLPTRTVPATTTQPVKRRNSFDNDQENISSGASKKQRLGDIFSPSSSFLGNKSLPPALQRRVSENNDSRGESILISCLLLKTLIYFLFFRFWSVVWLLLLQSWLWSVSRVSPSSGLESQDQAEDSVPCTTGLVTTLVNSGGGEWSDDTTDDTTGDATDMMILL